MPLNPGKLRHRITIEKPGQTQDPATGEMIDGWQLVDEVWAAKRPSSAREFKQSQAGQSEITGEFQIRYRDDVDATMRILHKGKVYNIEGVLEDNESGMEWLTLPYSQGVNDGN
ncbi:head-tail adaptor protein [Marinobacter salinus]|uniref:Head-tail adaptor protein n=1 Tax=Marinobacter salinus TaxID=1874317 RepID=A0A1D9GM21_9GAMM|nr:phage head closure protein [Marinobacter salinus]AOY88649.1 head-tail adaptor protein [Marinobacter salinus]